MNVCTLYTQEDNRPLRRLWCQVERFVVGLTFKTKDSEDTYISGYRNGHEVRYVGDYQFQDLIDFCLSCVQPPKTGLAKYASSN